MESCCNECQNHEGKKHESIMEPAQEKVKYKSIQKSTPSAKKAHHFQVDSSVVDINILSATPISKNAHPFQEHFSVNDSSILSATLCKDFNDFKIEIDPVSHVANIFNAGMEGAPADAFVNCYIKKNGEFYWHATNKKIVV